MSYKNDNDNDFDYGAPKKADVLIKNTETIVSKQRELGEKTERAIERIGEAIDLCDKNSREAAYLLGHSTEMFNALQAENSALKQELLYLAKQSENIYAGLAEKLNELDISPRDVGSAYIADELKEVFARLDDLAARIDAVATQRPEVSLNEKFAILYDKIDAVAAQSGSVKRGRNAAEVDEFLYDRLDRIEEQIRRYAEMTKATAPVTSVTTQQIDLTSLHDKLDHIAEGVRKNGETGKTVAPAQEIDLSSLHDRIDRLVDSVRRNDLGKSPYDFDSAEILERLDRLAENLRRSEGAHSMLADKLEILSMRVEQFGYESAKPQHVYTQVPAMPAVYAQPTHVTPPAQIGEIDYDKLAARVGEIEIDYDKLAAKVADILSVRESISPDYIASKVAEQIILPEHGGVTPDAKVIAREVAALIDVAPERGTEFDGTAFADRVVNRVGLQIDRLADKISEINVSAEQPDGDALADKIAQRLNTVNSESATERSVEIDGDALADKIAQRLGTANGESATGRSVEIDGDALADKIAQRLNTANGEADAESDNDALVERIVARVSEVIGEIAPAHSEVSIDSDDLADSIALKVGSLKPEDFEILVDDAGCASISKEIAEKLDYRVISTVIADKLREILEINAANAPDYEDMAERISEKITVAGINEDAIADKAAAVLSNYLPEFDTEEIADKVTGAVIDVVSAMPQASLDSEAICNEIFERLIERQEDNNYDIVIDDDGISRITAIVADELEKDTKERFDRLEDSIAKLTDMLASEANEREQTEEAEDVIQNVETDEAVGIADEDMRSLGEVVASEIEKGTSTRFDKVEQDIARIYELVSNIVVEEGDAVEYDEEIPVEHDYDYSRISRIVADELEKSVTVRLDGVEGKLNEISDMFAEIEQVDEAEDGDKSELIENDEVDDGEEAVAEEISAEEIEKLSQMVASIQTDMSARFDGVEQKITALSELISEVAVEDVEEADDASEDLFDDAEEAETEYSEGEEYEQEQDEYSRLCDMITARFDGVDEKISALSDMLTIEDEEDNEEYAESEGSEEYVDEEEGFTRISRIVAEEIEKGVVARFDAVESEVKKLTAAIEGIEMVDSSAYASDESYADDNAQLSKLTKDIKTLRDYIEGEVPVVANERIDKIAQDITRLQRLIEGELAIENAARFDKLQEEMNRLIAATEGKKLTSDDSVVASEINARAAEKLDRLQVEIEKLSAMAGAVDTQSGGADIEKIAGLVGREICAESAEKLDKLHAEIEKLSSLVGAESGGIDVERLSRLVGGEICAETAERFDKLYAEVKKLSAMTLSAENNEGSVDVAKISQLVESGISSETAARLDKLHADIERLTAEICARLDNAANERPLATSGDGAVIANERVDRIVHEVTKISQLVEGELAIETSARLDKLQEEMQKLTAIAGAEVDGAIEARLEKVADSLSEIKGMLKSGVSVAAREETAVAQAAPMPIPVQMPVVVPVQVPVQQPVVQVVQQPAPVPAPVSAASDDEEQELIKVSDLVGLSDLGDDDEEQDDDFLLGEIDMDKFSDDERMPGEYGEFGGVDFENMMKFNRSFIARIIQSDDDYKRYYGAVKHALLSYKKVNSNIAWGNERFNKGRETIARMKIRGKTLVVYLALDPNEYKTSVYHHADVSDNKSVLGTPMMIKVKSPLGVRKAVRLIDEMLAKRNGEKRDVPERDYAAMYPYENIEELINEGLVKDVRKK